MKSPDPYAQAVMQEFDDLPPEMRRMIAHAPYTFAGGERLKPDHLKREIASALRRFDVTGVGPVPTVYTQRRRRR